MTSMTALRILLQFTILGGGGIALAVLISQPDTNLMEIGFFSAFVVFLLALTLVLRQYTEKRLVPDHKLSFKPMGGVLLLLGAFCISYGINFFIGNSPLPNGSGTCRAICGLVLLASQSFGETVARYFALGLWSGSGLLLCFVGYKLKRAKAS